MSKNHIQINPKYHHIQDYIDKNKVGAYHVDSSNNVHALTLYPKDGPAYTYEFPPEETLDEINNVVAYVRSRII